MSKSAIKREIPTHSVVIDRRSGLEAGLRVPIDPRDWPCRTLAPSETLWRYMDLWKFEDMLLRSALFFARQDRFTDPFEGRFSDGNSAGLSTSDQAFYDAYGVSQPTKEQLETHRHCVFISCWHRNTKESREMWNAYTANSDSLVVTTSAKALYQFLPGEIMKSPVKYHGANFARSHTFGSNTLSFYKPSGYSFEKEFRMLRNLGEDESVLYDNPSDYGRYVKFTPKKVIHRVVTHPRATEALRRKVDALMGDYLKAIRREDSSLVW
jgi:hypothetical protein